MASYSYIPGQGFVVDEPIMSWETFLASTVLGGAAATAAFYFYSTSSSKSRDRTAVGVPGLYNLGNTCYANSLLQGLASSPSIHKWLTNLPMDHIKGGFLDAVRELIQGLNNPEEATLSPVNITTTLQAHRWNISIGSEQDLYELFNVFVTTWDDELSYLKRCLMTSSLLELQSTSTFGTADSTSASNFGKLSPILKRRGQEIKQLMWERCCSLIRLDAQLRPPCLGYTSTQYRCPLPECGYKTTKYESFTALTLMIPKSFMGQSFSIERLLRCYFCMELIRDAACERCKKAGKATSGLYKKHGFNKLPQCLIVRIERVGILPGGVFKLNERIDFGETLDVRPFCFNKNRALNEKDYDLSSQRRAEETSRILGGAELVNGQSPNSVPLQTSPIRPVGIETGFATPISTIEGGSFVAEFKEAARYAYQLRAVSEHIGVPESGHFVTYRRGIGHQEQHKWYRVSDADVTRVPISQVLSAEAYMLYYERIRPTNLSLRWPSGNFTQSVPRSNLAT